MKRMLLAAVLVGCASAPSTPPTPPATQPSEAKKAPDFSLEDTDGKRVALHDLLARGPVILAFFPKAFTGG
jgi:cytochrome oxidase Cu insertion factor (SCO1/SenC/PrrC family)